MRSTPLINALLAMAIYGLWAAYANHEHGKESWLMAGVIQACYAFVSTLTVSASARWVYLNTGGGMKGLILGFCSSFAVMVIIPVSIHSFMGTPELWLTILPGLVWGSVYIAAFLLLQHRQTIVR